MPKITNTTSKAKSVLFAKNTTTDATPTQLFLNGVDAEIIVPENTTWVFQITVAARRLDELNESAGYHFLGVIDDNAGSVALVGTVAKTVVAEDVAGWDCSVTANDALVITVTGEANKTILWSARVELTEVAGWFPPPPLPS